MNGGNHKLAKLGSDKKRIVLLYLDILVPTARNDDGVRVVRREPDAGHPVGVAFLLDGVLALGKGVPELDGPVTGARDDLKMEAVFKHG